MKFMLWLGKMAIAAVFVSTVTVFTAWTAVHTYLDKLIAHDQPGNELKHIEFSEFLSELTNQLNIIKQPAQKQVNDEPSSSEGTQSSTAAESSPDKTAEDTPKGGDAVPVWNQSRNSVSSVNEQRKRVMMSTEDLQKFKEKISSEDKMKLFTLLSSRLPQNEIQVISQLVEDGITEEKLAQMQSIVEKYLKPNEYQQLLDILKKY